MLKPADCTGTTNNNGTSRTCGPCAIHLSIHWKTGPSAGCTASFRVDLSQGYDSSQEAQEALNFYGSFCPDSSRRRPEC
eukprot:6117424-Amphidinium_carterae.1